MVRILHLEDDPADAYLVRRTLLAMHLETAITLVPSRLEFLAALEREWDVVIADNALPAFTSADAFALLRARHPHTPFIIVSGAGDESRIAACLAEGAADYILKDHLAQLIVTLYRVVPDARQHQRR